MSLDDTDRLRRTLIKERQELQVLELFEYTDTLYFHRKNVRGKERGNQNVIHLKVAGKTITALRLGQTIHTNVNEAIPGILAKFQRDGLIKTASYEAPGLSSPVLLFQIPPKGIERRKNLSIDHRTNTEHTNKPAEIRASASKYSRFFKGGSREKDQEKDQETGGRETYGENMPDISGMLYEDFGYS